MINHVAGWDPSNLHDLGHFLGLDLYYITGPAQSLTAAGEELQ